MSTFYLIMLVIVIFVLIYLFTALLFPEKFS